MRKLYVIEARYTSDRHGNTYWGPILKPGRKTQYAIYTTKAAADRDLTKLKKNDRLGWDVGIMGNDFPQIFRIVTQ